MDKQKLNRVNNGLNQLSDKIHPKLETLKEHFSSLINSLNNEYPISDVDKENSHLLATEIAIDSATQSVAINGHEEEYDILINSILKRVSFIKEKCDFKEAVLGIDVKDYDQIIDQLYSIAIEAEQIQELKLTKIPLFTFLSHQGQEISRLINEEIAVSPDGNGGGNNTSTFIKQSLEMIENLPLKNKNRIEISKEQFIMDSELLKTYCDRIQAELSE